MAIDFQLFALSVLIFAAVRALPSAWARQRAAQLGQAVVAAGVAASLWGFNRDASWDVWALYFFGAYGLGMMVLGQPRSAGGWLGAGHGRAGWCGAGAGIQGSHRIGTGDCLAHGGPCAPQLCGSGAASLRWCAWGKCPIRCSSSTLRCACWSMPVVSGLWPASPWINTRHAAGVLVVHRCGAMAVSHRRAARTPTLPTMLRLARAWWPRGCWCNGAATGLMPGGAPADAGAQRRSPRACQRCRGALRGRLRCSAVQLASAFGLVHDAFDLHRHGLATGARPRQLIPH